MNRTGFLPTRSIYTCWTRRSAEDIPLSTLSITNTNSQSLVMCRLIPYLQRARRPHHLKTTHIQHTSSTACTHCYLIRIRTSHRIMRFSTIQITIASLSNRHITILPNTTRGSSVGIPVMPHFLNSSTLTTNNNNTPHRHTPPTIKHLHRLLDQCFPMISHPRIASVINKRHQRHPPCSTPNIPPYTPAWISTTIVS